MPTVFLALGTNLGDRAENLRQARAALASHATILRASPIYKTKPWGYTEQPSFLNQVLEVKTDLPPLALLEFLKSLEQQLGRQATFRYGPRQIDLDILFYGQEQLDLPQLQIPHPRLAERAFVLVPLADLAPDFRHPVTDLTVTEMLAQIDQTGIQPWNP